MQAPDDLWIWYRRRSVPVLNGLFSQEPPQPAPNPAETMHPDAFEILFGWSPRLPGRCYDDIISST
jgi:hypothetical protein